MTFPSTTTVVAFNHLAPHDEGKARKPAVLPLRMEGVFCKGYCAVKNQVHSQKGPSSLALHASPFTTSCFQIAYSVFYGKGCTHQRVGFPSPMDSSLWDPGQSLQHDLVTLELVRDWEFSLFSYIWANICHVKWGFSLPVCQTHCSTNPLVKRAD